MQNAAEKVHRLYPVALDGHYKILDCDREMVGECGTTWMGAKRLVLFANDPIPEGERIEVSLRWPVQLPGGISLKLVIRGRVSETNGNLVTVAILKYEFHTRAGGRKTQAETLLPPGYTYAPKKEQRV